MENDFPQDLPPLAPAKPAKSRKPLLIGIVVAIHVLVIGGAFILQGLHRKAADEPAASASATAADESAVSTAAADNANTATPQPTETAALTPAAPAPTPSPAVTPAPVPVPSAPKIAAYAVRNGETWGSLATKFKTTAAELAKLNGMDTKKMLRVGQKIQVPADPIVTASSKVTTQTVVTSKEPAPSSSSKVAAAPAATHKPASTVYVVKKGDSLRKVAAHHAMTVADLRKLNALKSDTLRIGQKLKIRAATAVAHAAPAPNAATSTAQAAPPSSSVVSTADNSLHVVVKGETASGIAKHYGVKTAELLKVNKIADPKKIAVGMKLKIPSAAAAAATPLAPRTMPSQPVRSSPEATPVKAPLVPMPAGENA
ncbi:MAG: LysM peptidoglycan-binding domain-containing protein [Verrucomicrobiae bacterium]|nr:LysM peptidoglycan-binding domain-containing protein [Verrucomicrobiae bacterium]